MPLVGGAFDLVLSEHGVGAWCDPERWVAEAARLLRPGGRLVFLTNSLLSALCVPEADGPATAHLQRGQREVSRIRWPGGGVEHHPSHGDWIDVLRSNGFLVDALHELYAPRSVDRPRVLRDRVRRVGEQWPAEELWVAHLPG